MATKTDVMKALRTIPATETDTITIGDTQIEIVLNRTLSEPDMVNFVNEVCDGIVKDGRRCYGALNLEFKKALVRHFTNLKFTLTDKDYATLIQHTDIVRIITQNIDDSVPLALVNACDKQLAAMQSAETAIAAALVRPDPLDRIADMIEEFLGKMSGEIGGLDIEALNQTLTALKEDGLTADLVKNLMVGDKEEDEYDGSQDPAEPSDEPRTDEAD